MKLKLKWSKDLNRFFVAICGMVSNLVSVIRYFSMIEIYELSPLDKYNNILLEESISQLGGIKSRSTIKENNNFINQNNMNPMFKNTTS
jgi:hypothetical protein